MKNISREMQILNITSMNYRHRHPPSDQKDQREGHHVGEAGCGWDP